MYKKKVSVTCVFNPMTYSIQSLQLRTYDRHKICLNTKYDNTTSHTCIDALIETIVKRVLQYGYEIPYYKDFNALFYDIDFIPLFEPDILQYGYHGQPIKLEVKCHAFSH